MAGSVNKVILVGNLGFDPEIRTMNSGDRVANLRLATSERWKDKQTGENREKTEWHSIVIFNENLVRVAENYLRKGSKLYIEGQLQTRKWTDQNGQDRYTTEVLLQRFRGELHMLDSRRDDMSPQLDTPQLENKASTAQTEDTGRKEQFPSEFDDDEIPF